MNYRLWRDRLIEALDERYYTPEWLDWLSEQSFSKTFIGSRSSCIAELIEYPTGAKDIHVVAAAGDARDARDMIVPQLEQWASKEGCLAILVTSREAWARLLKPAGFETYKVAVRKDLVDG